ncbi:MAG: amidohydrolase [Acidobacteria bacterium]|nr:amidohydrolase [Acidobacteriota bacterium]
MRSILLSLVSATFLISASPALGTDPLERLWEKAEDVEPRVIEWRRDIHEHPELGNQEFRTAGLVADHLRSLGLDVATGVAHTGVVGTLRGSRPGPVVALRADMDALPVEEMTGLPFASKVVATWEGREVPVMHACGHDNHVAILMGVAEVLSSMKDELPGTVKFIFQPAEEGAPRGEEGGAALMVREGVLEGEDAPSAIFGLHVGPLPPGIYYKPLGALAAADELRIRVEGRQTHGSTPWLGVDPINAAAQIIEALQTIPSRQLDVTVAPAVISIGSIQGGVRGNIIPGSVEMTGTIRTLDEAMREQVHQKIRHTVDHVAASTGSTASVEIVPYAPVTWNDPDLVEQMLPSLVRAVGEGRVHQVRPIMGAEDWSYILQQVPGAMAFLGTCPPGVPLAKAAPNHSNRMVIDEDAMAVGTALYAAVALDGCGVGER